METSEKQILIAVKTYPFISIRHGEVVCTAGFLADGSWIRLYPIRFRYIEYAQRYKKYQWIHIETKKHRADYRPESYCPISAIRPGRRIGTQNNWAERKSIILTGGTRDMCWLEKQQQKKISLATVKPKQIDDFDWEETERDWNTRQKDYLKQLRIFENMKNKPLEKIPFLFRYRFICEAKNCRGHHTMVADWEVMELFRKMRDQYGEEKGLLKVKEKFLYSMCSADKDTHFFVGTIFLRGTWIITGVFWPPKSD